ncbi:unnamed protein product [Cylindrotheca closterium]|uniref:Uncharacterized protein n=1 Tax=Cylindrotheca closterium TaxID=2856 RepID=A0AAD2FXM8_9STRA|nr:unnamed protein product [Cylindrotheca closterium]
MTSKTLDSYSMLSCPATDALRTVQATKVGRKGRASGFDVMLSSSLLDLTFVDASVDSFPSIEWDSDDDFDSNSSLRSLDTLISDDSSLSSLGKRSRSDSRSSRRLVRSRKIKSGLASLALPLPISTTS